MELELIVCGRWLPMDKWCVISCLTHIYSAHFTLNTTHPHFIYIYIYILYVWLKKTCLGWPILKRVFDNVNDIHVCHTHTHMTYVINPLRSQNVLHSNPTIKPNAAWQMHDNINFQTSKNIFKIEWWNIVLFSIFI